MKSKIALSLDANLVQNLKKRAPDGNLSRFIEQALFTHFKITKQKDLDAEKLSELIVSISRKEILEKATKAYSIRKIQATEKVVQACEEIVI